MHLLTDMRVNIIENLAVHVSEYILEKMGM